MTSDELGLDKPGALVRYFAERWLEEPSARGEQLIAWLLEAALGRNSMHFIEKTKAYVDARRESEEIVPVDAFDGFTITGDPVEDTIIPHAVFVWTCMNDRPWPEEVYHRWLDSLLAAGSAEAAYLAASLWPAHDLMAKVTYRPARWLVHQGQLDAEAERLILMEILKGTYGPRTTLYGPLEYDDVPYPEQLPEQYIRRHGFTHPICGLVRPIDFGLSRGLEKRIQDALAAPSWSEGVKGAAMLLYLSLKAFSNLRDSAQETLNILEQNLFKLDERHANIINFHMDRIEKIDYNLIKYYINYLIILYNKIIHEGILSTKMFSKYISIGLRTKDIFYIGNEIKDIIFYLTFKEREKLDLWLENQTDDLRIKDIFFAIYMEDRINYTMTGEKLKNEHVEKKIEDIYGKTKYFDKIRLFIDKDRIYFKERINSNKIINFIEDILKREEGINFNHNFREDYAKIMYSWHPNRRYFTEEYMFLKSNNVGLYLYYEILKEWVGTVVDLKYNIKDEKEFNLYSFIRKKITKNLYTYTTDDVEIRLKFHLNKIERNNFPYEDIKCKFIIELINIVENNYNKIHLKDEINLIRMREVILSSIDLIWDKLKNSRLIELLWIDNKLKNMIIY